MPKQSAGLLLHTGQGDSLRVLIVHPSGSYNRNAPYSLPKGEVDEGEALEDTARRETREEVGIDVTGPLTSLGHVEYTKSKKRVFAWAAPLPEGAEPRCASWEIDRADLVTIAEAKALLHKDQAQFIDRFLTLTDP